MRWTATQDGFKLRFMLSPTSAHSLPLQAVSSLDERGFVEQFAGVVELSPWVARRAWQRRPFATHEALFDALAHCIRNASPDEQLAMLRSHPELAGREAAEGTMTPESNSEQGRLGLNALSHADWETMNDLNRRYRERFGFPFIVALRLHGSLASVFQSCEARLGHDPQAERVAALEQVCEVTRGRLQLLLSQAPTTP